MNGRHSRRLPLHPGVYLWDICGAFHSSLCGSVFAVERPCRRVGARNSYLILIFVKCLRLCHLWLCCCSLTSMRSSIKSYYRILIFPADLP